MARCITPIWIKNPKTGRGLEVPCSRCWPCLERRANAWAARILQEKKRSNSAHFVTLTYDDAHVPIDKETMNLTLDKTEIPRYMKRLRKLHNQAYKIDKKLKAESKPLKYYAVGEYGEDLERPHYHIILFNAIIDLIPMAWIKEKKLIGLIDIGEQGVTAGGARYLCQYMLTGQEETGGRQKPFSLMSKNLGSNYITTEIKKWHLQTTGTAIEHNGKIIETRDRYYMIQDGFKIALPRYYRDKIFPKIYREIDVPLITAQHDQKEWETKIKQNPEAYYHNINGQRETNKSTYQKKQKKKTSFSLKIDSVN